MVRPTALLLSVAGHCLLLVWLLYRPEPIFVAPSSVMKGESGTALTYYQPSRAGTALATTRPRSRLTWKPASVKESKHQPKAPVSIEPPEEASSDAQPAPLAGTRYGSLFTGPGSGEEVRPALRVSGSEPVIGFGDLAGQEGNVIIEITIDERGNIVEKNVIQSLSPVIDHKVLAALEDWRFLPATRDGVAIPSKEDVYYHFPVRR